MKIHNSFSQLRLSAYISVDLLERVDAFEYMGLQWTGETCGFTQTLQLEEEPEVTRAILIDLNDEKTKAFGEVILNEIGIPLRFGMQIEEIDKVLQTSFYKRNSFIASRVEFEYLDKDTDLYVSCVLQASTGLIFVSVLHGKEILMQL